MLEETIRAARRRKGMTQEALAEKMGLSRQAIAKWESGQGLPTAANWLKLSELLEIPLPAAEPPAGEVSAPSAAPPPAGGDDPPSAAPHPTGGAATPPTAPPAAASDPPTRRTVAVGWGLYLAFLGLVFRLCGVEWLFWAAGFSALAAPAFLFVRGVRRGRPAPVRRLFAAALPALAGLGVVMAVWAASFWVGAGYRAEAVWGLAPDDLAAYPGLTGWMAEFDDGQSPIAVLQTALPGGENRTAYLVYRRGLAAGGRGRVRPNPLRYRFTVTYPGGGAEEARALDLVLCEGRQPYTAFFSEGDAISTQLVLPQAEQARLAGELYDLSALYFDLG